MFHTPQLRLHMYATSSPQMPPNSIRCGADGASTDHASKPLSLLHPNIPLCSRSESLPAASTAGGCWTLSPAAQNSRPHPQTSPPPAPPSWAPPPPSGGRPALRPPMGGGAVKTRPARGSGTCHPVADSVKLFFHND